MTIVSHMLVTFLLVNMNFICNATGRFKGNKMRTQPIKLYYMQQSPGCRSVMMTAKVIGVELQLNFTNILEHQHMTPEFLKMNPQHSLPTMDDNGFILWESRAIMGYLVNAYAPNDFLYPKDPKVRALVDQLLYFDIGTLTRRYIKAFLPAILTSGEIKDNNKKLNEALGWLNTMLEGRTFVAGTNMTIADISIIVAFTNLDAYGYDISAYENIVKWFERAKNALEPYGYKEIDYAGGQIMAEIRNELKPKTYYL